MLRLWLAMAVGVACLLASGVISSMARAQPSADPAAVVTAYEMARNRHDVDTALSYFADDAIVSQRNANYNGKDEIRKFLDGVSARSRFIIVSDRKVTGNRVSWTERAGGGQGPDPQPPVRAPGGFGGASFANTSFSITVEAVVQDGKIQSLSYLFGGQAVRIDPELEGRAELPAGFGLATVLAVLLAILMVASMGLRRPGRTSSSLHGRLMQDLQGWADARQ